MIDAALMARVREAFEAARAAPDDESRAAAIDRIAAGDVAVRKEALSLLQHAGDDSMLVVGAAARAADVAVQAALADAEDAWLPEGTRVGEFTVVGHLGAGGMSLVHRAVQDEPRREVALKILRVGAWSVDARRRLRREAAALARLQHPGIAQVYAAGEFTPDGAGAPAPYFAMELVDGVPITAFAAANGLDLRRRLGLLADVCDAVQHAHERAVIHRDIKPGNVLVGADGRPRLLDFGVAMVTTEDVDATAARTSAAAIIGTLPYMAPEQIEGRADLIDARTDVYALGALAYEVLSGRRAIDPPTSSILSAARWALDTEPVRLGRLLRAARGDIEAVVTKAMEKEPSRRYASAAALAADLRRAIAGHAVLARRPGALRDLRLFFRRNPALTAALAVALMTLLAGAAVASWQAIRATRAEAEARRREANIRSAARAMLFDIHDAIEAMPGALEARQRLSAAASELLLSLAASRPEDAEVAAEAAESLLRLAYASGPFQLANEGDLAGAAELTERALDLARNAERLRPDNTALRLLRLRAESRRIWIIGHQRGAATDQLGELARIVREQEAIAAIRSNDAGVLVDLADSFQLLADRHLWIGESDAAIRACEKGLESADAAIRLSGGAEKAVLAAAVLHFVAAEIGFRAEDPRAMLVHLNAMQPLIEAGLARSPDHYEFRRWQKGLLLQRAWAHARLGSAQAAIADIEAGVSISTSDLANDPADSFAHRAVMIGQTRRGDVYEALARHAASDVSTRVSYAEKALESARSAAELVAERVHRGWQAPWEADYAEDALIKIEERERLLAAIRAEAASHMLTAPPYLDNEASDPH